MNSFLKIIAEAVYSIAMYMPNVTSLFHMYQPERPKSISNSSKSH